MDLVATMLAAGEFDYDAVILAGFGEHGKDALQEMLAGARAGHRRGRRARRASDRAAVLRGDHAGPLDTARSRTG